MYIMYWISVCILAARASGTAKYIIYVWSCTLFRAVWVAFLVAKACLYLNDFGYFIFRLP